MKINFDSNQDSQLDAIRSVVDVFAGQPLTRAVLQWQCDAFGGELLTEMGVGNSLVLGDEAILRNVQEIQAENELEPAQELQGLNFSVEMETGTGKTYVCLGTLFELNPRYGWKKFIIVVPRAWVCFANVNPGRRSFHFACLGLFSFGLTAL